MAAKDDFDVLRQFIEWAGIEGDEAENFVKEMMTRRGHKPGIHWMDADPNDKGEGKSTNILGLVPGGNKRNSGGSNFQYGG